LDDSCTRNPNSKERNNQASYNVDVVPSILFNVDSGKDSNLDILLFSFSCFALTELLGISGGNLVFDEDRRGWLLILCGVLFAIIGFSVLAVGRVPSHWGL
jgi:hypothetical protein